MGGGMADTGETITISGGTLTVDAGGDGIDSNGSVTVTGGDIVVWGPTSSGNCALDSNGGFDVSGGTLLAVGSSGMAESPDSGSAQAWIAATVSGSAGDEIQITDADGTVVFSTTAEKEFQTVVFSSSDIDADGTYTVSAGATSVTVTAGEAVTGGMGGGMGGGPRGGTAPDGAAGAGERS